MGIAIFIGIYDQGFIDLKSPFVIGQVKSGHVGVLLLFLGVFLICILLFVPTAAKHKIEVIQKGNKIIYTGRLNLEAFDLFLRTIQEIEKHSNTMEHE